MEILVFLAIVGIVGVALLYRARRGTTSWRQSPTAWLTGRNPSKFDYMGGQRQNAATIADWKDRPLSRDEGHGKDGGA